MAAHKNCHLYRGWGLYDLMACSGSHSTSRKVLDSNAVTRDLWKGQVNEQLDERHQELLNPSVTYTPPHQNHRNTNASQPSSVPRHHQVHYISPL